jgi:hypothetical protein
MMKVTATSPAAELTTIRTGAGQVARACAICDIAISRGRNDFLAIRRGAVFGPAYATRSIFPVSPQIEKRPVQIADDHRSQRARLLGSQE